jgi:hypothetical protein
MIVILLRNVSIIILYVMDHYSWMYRDSPQELYRKGYYKGVESFINFILSNPKNISGGEIRCLCVKFKNKKFHQ